MTSLTKQFTPSKKNKHSSPVHHFETKKNCPPTKLPRKKLFQFTSSKSSTFQIPKSTNQMDVKMCNPTKGWGIHFCSLDFLFPIIQALPSRSVHPPKGPAGQFDASKKSPEKVKGIRNVIDSPRIFRPRHLGSLCF